MIRSSRRVKAELLVRLLERSENESKPNRRTKIFPTTALQHRMAPTTELIPETKPSRADPVFLGNRRKKSVQNVQLQRKRRNRKRRIVLASDDGRGGKNSNFFEVFDAMDRVIGKRSERAFQRGAFRFVHSNMTCHWFFRSITNLPCSIRFLLSFLHVVFFRRSTVQVKTHAQVIMKKQKNGVNIFAELDRFEAMQEARTEKLNDNQKMDGNGYDETLASSSFALPQPPQSQRKEQEASHACGGEEARYSNNQTQTAQTQHAYNLSQSIGGQFETPSVPMPSLFQPVTTTTTVTTTVVGNHAHPNVFHPPNQHFYGMNHPSFIQHCDPYQFAPSFDAMARATSTAAAVATSALFPTTNALHVPMVPRANHGLNLSSDFLLPSQNDRSNSAAFLTEEEVAAIRALRDISTNSEKDDPEGNYEGIVIPI